MRGSEDSIEEPFEKQNERKTMFGLKNKMKNDAARARCKHRPLQSTTKH
jgi:hypothetical protein